MSARMPHACMHACSSASRRPLCNVCKLLPAWPAQACLLLLLLLAAASPPCAAARRGDCCLLGSRAVLHQEDSPWASDVRLSLASAAPCSSFWPTCVQGRQPPPVQGVSRQDNMFLQGACRAFPHAF
jgi:hypothetical protein